MRVVVVCGGCCGVVVVPVAGCVWSVLVCCGMSGGLSSCEVGRVSVVVCSVKTNLTVILFSWVIPRKKARDCNCIVIRNCRFKK